MKALYAVLLFSLVPSLVCGAATAQGVPRIKGQLVSFDGKVLTLKTADPEPMQIGLMPGARIVRQEKRSLSDLKTGDFVGATLTVSKDGSRLAQEVHLFPQSLLGSGEGYYPLDSAHFAVGGTVSAVSPSGLSLDYRGGGDAKASSCTGRAVPAGGCHGHADLVVPAGAPVTALVEGDKSLLVPGAVLAVSILAGNDGHPMTPGLTVELADGATPAAAPTKPATQAR
jgi:hypothetical protein